MPTTIQLPAPARGPAPAPHRRHRAFRAATVAAAAAGVLALAGGGLAIANHAMIQHDQRSFTATGIRELVVDLDAGDLTLQSGPAGGQVTVNTARDWAWGKPESRHTVDNGVLTLTGSCPHFGVGTCRVNHRVTVPAGVVVRVSISSGDISATRLDLAQLEMLTDSGDISAHGINTRRAHAETSSGNVELSLSQSPMQVTAETSSGDVTLTVPDGAYNVLADSSAGEVRINVDDNPTATRQLSAHSSSGDVTIDHR